MMKCLNCDDVASYQLVGKAPGRVICAAHLPWTVKLSKDLGTKIIEISTEPIEIPVDTSPKFIPNEPVEPKKSKKEPEAVVVEEAPAVEEVEEVVVEEEK